MKIYLIAPKNPESFWTFDRILKEFPNELVMKPSDIGAGASSLA